jgi:hypothetical protein
LLYIHDVHAIIGEREYEYEDTIRDEYSAAIADDDTRLLWYLTSPHGAGDAYHSVTMTVARDGEAWSRLAERQRHGDLADLITRLESMRYGLISSLLVPTKWSPLGDIEPTAVPSGVDRELALFRQDTFTGAAIHERLESAWPATTTSNDVLTCVAGFRPALDPTGSTVVVMYRVAPQEQLQPVFNHDSGWTDWPGSLVPELPEGVEISSRYLRTVPWTPMP